MRKGRRTKNGVLRKEIDSKKSAEGAQSKLDRRYKHIGLLSFVALRVDECFNYLHACHLFQWML